MRFAAARGSWEPQNRLQPFRAATPATAPKTPWLHRVVSAHLETFLAEASQHDGRGLPQYVQRELREFVRCGVLAFGFARAVCRRCKRDMVVALSCKKRGVCPSCGSRRMCGTAAHLTDHVLPDIPVRQWVLSVPFGLRLLLAREPAALSAVGRIFVQEIGRFQLGRASRSGVCRARTGAICFPQRFGGSLNLNVHYHVAVPDGVFTLGAGERAQFHQTRAPDCVDLETVALNVELRTLGWLRRRGHLKEDHEETPDTESSAIDACLRGSLGMGELTAVSEKRPKAAAYEQDAPPRPTKSARRGADSRGFDVHAGVTVAASDREGRERLLRYCARPALSLERMSLRADDLHGRRARLRSRGRSATLRSVRAPSSVSQARLGRASEANPRHRCPRVSLRWKASVHRAHPRQRDGKGDSRRDGSVVRGTTARARGRPISPTPRPQRRRRLRELG